MQFYETTFYFGRVKPMDTYWHPFAFVNTGDAVLEISSVKTECGCTVVGEWNREVQPGQAGVIPIRLDASELSGPINKAVTVTCNDRERDTFFLQIQATVVRPIDLVPPSLEFVRLMGEETNETQVVRIVNNLDKHITLEPPVITNPLLKAGLTTVRPGREFELRVTLTGAAPNARRSDTLAIKTSTTNVPWLEIPVATIPRPAVLATPGIIRLPSGPLESDYRYPIRIHNYSPLLIRLSDPSVNTEGIRISIEEGEAGRDFMLTLIFPEGFQADLLQSLALTLKTSHPRHPVIRLPIIQLSKTPVLSPMLPPELEGRSQQR